MSNYKKRHAQAYDSIDPVIGCEIEILFMHKVIQLQ
jgi:hypothetical protein